MAKALSRVVPLARPHFVVGWAYPMVAMLLATGSVLGATSARLSVAVLVVFVALAFGMGWKVDRMLMDATTDSLTHVLSRQQFDACFRSWFAQNSRSGGLLALLIIDLDQLKAINDTRGHLAGDEALRLVGESLRQTVRSSDLVARYGGDEFVIVAPKTSAAQALALADRIRGNLRALALAHRLSHLPTVSIGVAASNEATAAGLSEAALFDAADQALYLSKHNGRDRASLGQMTWPTHFQ